MQYKDLKLKKNIPVDILKWEDNEIKIKNGLGADEIYDIVMITLQKSAEGGIYNPLKIDMYYHLNLVYAMTDIEFSAEDREDEVELYNELELSGFMEAFLEKVSPKLYEYMVDSIEKTADILEHYNVSAASVFKNFVEDLPANAEAAQAIVDNFNPEKYQAVVDFAKAANGNRPI